MTQQTHYYSATSRDFLAKAHAYLNEGDLLQASEKGWGAAAEMVKSVAEAKGWPHNTHRDMWRAVNRLAHEAGDRAMLAHFHIAESLHINFYEGWLPQEAVEHGISQVEELLQQLYPLAE